MGKNWNPAVVDLAGNIPDGMYNIRITQGEETETKDGRYRISVKSRVTDGAHKNAPYNFGFMIGTPEDPGADEEDTWRMSFPARLYKSFLKACDVPETGDVEEELESLEKVTLGINLNTTIGKDGKSYQNVNAFYKAGSVESEPTPAPKPSKLIGKLIVKKGVPAESVEDNAFED